MWQREHVLQQHPDLHQDLQRTEANFLVLLAQYKEIIEEWLESGFVKEFLELYQELSRLGGFRQWLDLHIASQEEGCTDCQKRQVVLMERLLFRGANSPIWPLLKRFSEAQKKYDELQSTLAELLAESLSDTEEGGRR